MTDFVYDSSKMQMSLQLPLFLCVEEHDNKDEPSSIDNKIFILWDNERQDYVINGNNKEANKYTYRYKTDDELYNFIEQTVGTNLTTSIILFNLNDVITNELIYISFESDISEIVRFDKVKLNKTAMFAIFEDIRKN
jgi:hypothetical protein